MWLVCIKNEGSRDKVLPYIILKKMDEDFKKKCQEQYFQDLILKDNPF